MSECTLLFFRSALDEGTTSPTGSSGSGGTGSCGSDTPHKSEFSQVKLHAHNQIVLSQVLSDERERVRTVVSRGSTLGEGRGMGTYSSVERVNSNRNGYVQ